MFCIKSLLLLHKSKLWFGVAIGLVFLKILKSAVDIIIIMIFNWLGIFFFFFLILTLVCMSHSFSLTKLEESVI